MSIEFVVYCRMRTSDTLIIFPAGNLNLGFKIFVPYYFIKKNLKIEEKINLSTHICTVKTNTVHMKADILCLSPLKFS